MDINDKIDKAPGTTLPCGCYWYRKYYHCPTHCPKIKSGEWYKIHIRDNVPPHRVHILCKIHSQAWLLSREDAVVDVQIIVRSEEMVIDLVPDLSVIIDQ